MTDNKIDSQDNEKSRLVKENYPEVSDEVFEIFEKGSVFGITSLGNGNLHIHYFNENSNVTFSEFLEAQVSEDPKRYDSSGWNPSEHFGKFIINGKIAEGLHMDGFDSTSFQKLSKDYFKINNTLIDSKPERTGLGMLVRKLGTKIGIEM